MSMEAMLREFASRHDEDARKPPTFIAQALRDEAEFYARYLPFTVGDLVTPRRGATYRGAGDAHIVIGVIDEAECDLTIGEVSSTNYGRRNDLRVLRWTPAGFAPFWVESAQFEAWVDPHADVTAPASSADAAA